MHNKLNQIKNRIIEAIGATSDLYDSNGYSQTFVFERVANRLSDKTPLEARGVEPFKFTNESVAQAIEKGVCKHSPNFEKDAFEITARFLPIIESEDVDRYELARYMESCV